MSRFPLRLALLLGAALMINYVDRGTISTASPLIKSEFHLDAFQMGLLLSAFFTTYVVSQPLMGILVDRLGAARVLAAGFTLWSVGTFLAGLSSGVLSLVALRLVMGLGESVCYPSGFALISQRVTDQHRARATAIMQVGSVVGPALGTFVGGAIMIRYGWRTMFIALGVASLAWLIPWSGELRRSARAEKAPAGGPGWIDVVGHRVRQLLLELCLLLRLRLGTALPGGGARSVARCDDLCERIHLGDGLAEHSRGRMAHRPLHPARRDAEPGLQDRIVAERGGGGGVPLIAERRRGHGGGGAAPRNGGRRRSQLTVGGRADATLRRPAGHRTLDGHAECGEQYRGHSRAERERVSHQAKRRPLHRGAVGYRRDRAAGTRGLAADRAAGGASRL